MKMLSVVLVGPPFQPHEQLICCDALSLAMRLRTSFGMKLLGLPSYRNNVEIPGDMELTISISSDTSPLPLMVPVVGTPVKPSSRMFVNVMAGRPARFS